MRYRDRSPVLRPYQQHVESLGEEMEQRRCELRLLANTGTHAATGVAMLDTCKSTFAVAILDTCKSTFAVAMLDTCKSTFAVAIVRFPGYDVDMSCAASEDLRALLQHTTYGRSSSSRTRTGTCRVLTFMAGVVSCCSEERQARPP
jgi:hypothetical protein